MRGVPGAFRITPSTRRLLDGARGSPLDDGVGPLRRCGQDSPGEARRAENDESTDSIDPAQETKLRLGVALFPDRLLDTPSRESNTKG